MSGSRDRPSSPGGAEPRTGSPDALGPACVLALKLDAAAKIPLPSMKKTPMPAPRVSRIFRHRFRRDCEGRTKKNPEHLKGIPGHPWEGEFGYLYKESGSDPAFVARKTSKSEK
jgi:hypothetical protein